LNVFIWRTIEFLCPFGFWQTAFQFAGFCSWSQSETAARRGTALAKNEPGNVS